VGSYNILRRQFKPQINAKFPHKLVTYILKHVKLHALKISSTPPSKIKIIQSEFSYF
jgi:hypothetical protein